MRICQCHPESRALKFGEIGFFVFVVRDLKAEFPFAFREHEVIVVGPRLLQPGKKNDEPERSRPVG